MKQPRRYEAAIIWGLMMLLVTVVLSENRNETDQAHVVLTYLLVVVGGSSSSGRRLGLSLAGVAFFLIDFFFQVPYDRLAIGKPLDFVILLAFLVTALVTTQLLAVARSEGAEALKRADEVATLSLERVELMRVAQHAEALREADRLKDVVLASVSHDLRTPLTTIKALAQDSALRGDENAAVIEEQADRLSRFVGDLLDLSRLQGGAMPSRPEVNTAEDLIGAAIRQMGSLIDGRLVLPQIDKSQPALVGRFDFVQSLRILNNLLENACRYAPADTKIELDVHRDSEALVFRVCDRGPGVAPADRQRIFELFYRAGSGPPDAGRAGLGLSIARRLAELQGGALQYEPRDGGGSVFVLRLPALDVDEAAGTV
ncbi:MAG TPA: ATP-binding protein [Gemmatimonadales bacterium]